MFWHPHWRTYTRHMKAYSFHELEKEILVALDALDKKNFFGKDKKLSVVDGFTYLPIQDNVGSSLNIGGKSLPLVAVIDSETGQLWQFSLKQLVPRIELN